MRPVAPTSGPASPSGGRAGTAARRRAARLRAVQALYQIEQTGAEPDAVIAEFGPGRRPLAEAEEQAGREADPELFADLVRGAAREKARLDLMIGEVLVEGWTTERLSMVLLAILRVGAYELSARADVPPRVTINEYVELAHDFFGGKEPALVNAVLDRLAKRLRPGEMGPASPKRPGA